MINTDYMLQLKTMFPKVRKNQAVTGNIPIAYFEKNEKEIRREMQYQGFKAIYRGPRISNMGFLKTHTVRFDATSVLLYRK